MGIPHTLAGLIGFMIFVTFLFGVAQQQGSDTSEAMILQEQLSESIDTTASSDNIFTGILNAGGTGLKSIQVMLGYIVIFMSKQGIGGLPSEFNVLFSIISITAIIAILRFIRGVTD